MPGDGKFDASETKSSSILPYLGNLFTKESKVLFSAAVIAFCPNGVKICFRENVPSTRLSGLNCRSTASSAKWDMATGSFFTFFDTCCSQVCSVMLSFLPPMSPLLECFSVSVARSHVRDTLLCFGRDVLNT